MATGIDLDERKLSRSLKPLSRSLKPQHHLVSLIKVDASSYFFAFQVATDRHRRRRISEVAESTSQRRAEYWQAVAVDH